MNLGPMAHHGNTCFCPRSCVHLLHARLAISLGVGPRIMASQSGQTLYSFSHNHGSGKWLYLKGNDPIGDTPTFD